MNYLAHAQETQFKVPEQPDIFARWRSTLSVDGQSVPIPPRDDHFDWRLNLAAIGNAIPVLRGFPEELLMRCFRGPTTLIRGSLSDYVKSADLEVFEEAFPNTRVIDIDGAGHWVHADKPVEFLAALVR